MDNPITSGFSFKKAAQLAGALFLLMLILDFIGLTDLFLYPAQFLGIKPAGTAGAGGVGGIFSNLFGRVTGKAA